MRTAFSLIELLATVAIIALLLALLLPVLSSVQETRRVVACASNLRQAYLACRMYADVSRGWGPAIGEPYAALPNWALVVQDYAGRNRSGNSSLYRQDSVLVCPTIQLYYRQVMTRTYAMNATGHAGQQGDSDDYDNPARQAHLRFDRVNNGSSVPVLMDSARALMSGSGPPPPRTASMIDFRQTSQVAARLRRFHRRDQSFNVVAFDGSGQGWRDPQQGWKRLLP